MNCQTCGTNNAPGATICAACGMALTATQSGSTGAAVPFSPALPGGTKLSNGAYTIGNVLGQGGFGITYKGADMTLRRFVAIKEFYPPGCMRQTSLQTIVPAAGSDSEFAASKTRFLEEARTLARFNHPGIVRVFGIFEENNTAYMVMEFLEGQTLGERLKQGPLSESEGIELMRKLGSALEVIHGANLIHRDLKPDNIFLANGGRAVLIDFGTARAYAANRTVRQTAMLTPGYAPLEQYGSTSRFGAYSDVYALASTLYHAVTGQAPPPATDRATGVEVRRADAVNPNLSPAIGQAIEWGMQIKAEHRPQSITEFLGALSGKAAVPPPLQQQAASASASAVNSRTQAVLPPNVSRGGGTPGAPGSGLWTRMLEDGQMLTNADPYRALEALTKAMKLEKVSNVTPNTATLQVNGSNGVGLTSWGQQIQGQVIPGNQGTTISVRAQESAPAITDFGRGKAISAAILRATELALRNDQHATQPSTPPSFPQNSFPQNAYPQNAYSPPIPAPSGYPQYAPQRMVQGGKGTTVLVLGILGLFCCGFLGPIAWAMGNSALQEYGDQDPGDRGSVVAGRIMGIISTCFMGFVVLLWILEAAGS